MELLPSVIRAEYLGGYRIHRFSASRRKWRLAAMSTSTDRVKCLSCGASIDASTDTTDYRTPCAACGGLTRSVHVSVVDGARARDGVGIKAKRPGTKRPFFESSALPSHSISRQKLVHREQVIDRANDHYLERVTDYETGEVIHHCEESLSRHQGHGSAKPKRTANGR